jgi:hypothetical protein
VKNFGKQQDQNLSPLPLTPDPILLEPRGKNLNQICPNKGIRKFVSSPARRSLGGVCGTGRNIIKDYFLVNYR